LAFALLAGLYFLSGASALVFQIAWLRLLALIVGVTVHAASAVLASFMGGLALGSWLGGRSADRARYPLRAFGLVELGIGINALAIPGALGVVERFYVTLHAYTPDAGASLTVARIVCASAVLLVPTTLMGASLPLLSKYVQASAAAEGQTISRIGLLYAANTTGGIAGTFLAGFVLIGWIGVGATTGYAAAANVLVGSLALAGWSFGARGTGVDSADRSSSTTEWTKRDATSRVQRAVLAVFAISGFAALAIEVVWFRLLVLFLPATTYAFTTMLGTLLLGIAIGSAICVRAGAAPFRSGPYARVAPGVGRRCCRAVHGGARVHLSQRLEDEWHDPGVLPGDAAGNGSDGRELSVWRGRVAEGCATEARRAGWSVVRHQRLRRRAGRDCRRLRAAAAARHSCQPPGSRKRLCRVGYGVSRNHSGTGPRFEDGRARMDALCGIVRSCCPIFTALCSRGDTRAENGCSFTRRASRPR
jgi:MFS family permease